jgi:serine protease Do
MAQPRFSSHPSAHRLLLSGILALQAAVAGTVISEMAMATPLFGSARVAVAQNASIDSAESAVVHIRTERGLGSGVIVNAEGLIVTNAHVVEGAQDIEVTIRGRAISAEVVAMGNADCLDLALLQISSPPPNLPIARMGDIKQVYKTQTVFAIGFPGAVRSESPTVTRGIVSNLHAQWGVIQFDGNLNPGNSGGAVVNDSGELVGIATFKLKDTEGMSFAVSVDKVLAFIDSYHQGNPAMMGQAFIPGSNPDSGQQVQSLSLDGQTARGVLQAGDSLFCGDSTLTDVYTFEAEAGQSIMLDMVGQDMSIDVVLVSPSGDIIAGDRSNGRNQAAIVLEKLPETGTYSVMAKASQQDRDGRYQLRATEPVLVERGMLDRRTRPCTSEGLLCETYAFQGNADQTVTVILHQAEFAPFVILLDEAGEPVATGQSGDAFANFTLPAAGWYTLVVSNTQPEATGEFVVSVHDTATLMPAEEISQR